MTRSAEVDVLGVWLGQRRVGTLVRLPDDRITFAFDPSYAEDTQRPVLSLGFKGEQGGLVTPPTAKTKLPPFFANLLPEGRLRTYLAARAGTKKVRDFPLIAVLGEDLPGNVIVKPEGVGEAPRQVKMDADSTRPPLKFSLAGVQLKFSAVEAATGGLTIPVSGVGGDWIVKLPSPVYAGVPAHEYQMLELARAIGIAVPQTRLIDAESIAGLPADAPLPERQVLAIRRFDRAEGQRIHMEDFAQVFGVYPDDKYKRASTESIAKVLYAESGLEAVLEVVRRMVFTILIGNADMHLKNWSLIYRDGRSAELSPGYDFVGTVAYLPGDRNLALSLGGTKVMARIDLDRFARFANKVGAPALPISTVVDETVRAFKLAWRNLEMPAKLPAAHREILEEHQKSLALWRLV